MIIDFAKLRSGRTFEISTATEPGDPPTIAVRDTQTGDMLVYPATVDCQEGIDALLASIMTEDTATQGDAKSAPPASDPVGDLKYSTDHEFADVRKESRRATGDLNTRLNALVSEIQCLRTLILEITP